MKTLEHEAFELLDKNGEELCEPTLDSRLAFIGWYVSERWTLGTDDRFHYPIFSPQFADWTAERLKTKIPLELPAHWIAFLFHGDGERAFERLKELWTEFVASDQASGPNVSGVSRPRRTAATSVYDLLPQILLRPPLYLGRPSISCLAGMLNGIAMAGWQMKLRESPAPLSESHLLRISSETEISGDFAWWRKLLLVSVGDEVKAFERFRKTVPTEK